MAYPLGQFLAMKSAGGYYYNHPLLPRKSKMFIGAAAKSYKSMLALNFAYCLAEGWDILGTFKTTNPLRVLLLEQEIGPERLKERLQKMHGTFGGTLVMDNLWIVSKDLGIRLDNKTGIDLLCGHIEEARPHIVLFDPLRKFHGLVEDDSTQMGGLMRALSLLQDKYDFASIIVHHHSKPSENRPYSSPLSLRGSSVLFDEGDSYITVTKPDFRTPHELLLHFVLRSAGDPWPMRVVLNTETLVFSRKEAR